MNLERHIFLTGFMGAGKSKVGAILAAHLGRDFVDTDVLIEEAAGKSIPDIFREGGEEAFRRLEHEAVRRASEMPASVISLGGGAVTREENWEVIRRSGVSVYLQASPETIFERVSRKTHRPLLAGLNDQERMEKIRSMLSVREPCYRRADLIVESLEERTPERTADLIIQKLERGGRG
ncbi:MAG: shikimate kinase [Candidatus Latescibacteria bacterium]|nr:shikimate kinase [Candidatus Latescibacterota bacterium]